MKLFTKLFLSLVLTVSIGFAWDNAWKLDKAHSTVSFSIAHMVISEVTGRFNDFDVAFSGSKDDLSDATVEAIIKVNSINTDHNGRDNDLKGENFFDVAKYPEIRFKSTSFEKIDEKRYEITGDLTIRDITRKVTFNVEHRGTLKTQRGMVSAWKATLSINRFDYGLKWNRAIETGGLIVGETVSINMTFELRK